MMKMHGTGVKMMQKYTISLPGVTTLNFVIGTSVSEMVSYIYIIKGVLLNAQKIFIGTPKRRRRQGPSRY